MMPMQYAFAKVKCSMKGNTSTDKSLKAFQPGMVLGLSLFSPERANYNNQNLHNVHGKYVRKV